MMDAKLGVQINRMSGLLLILLLVIACGSDPVGDLFNDAQHKYVADCGKLINFNPGDLTQASMQLVGCTYFSDGTVDYPQSQSLKISRVLFAFAANDATVNTCTLHLQGVKLMGQCGQLPAITLGWLSAKGSLSLNRDLNFNLQGLRAGKSRTLKMADLGTNYDSYDLLISL